jgi:hypothetical protein
MTGGRPVAEKYLKPMTEVKNARMSAAWWLLPIRASRKVSEPPRTALTPVQRYSRACSTTILWYALLADN